MGAEHLLPEFVGAFVPLMIHEYQRVGVVPDAWEIQAAKGRWDKLLAAENGTEGGAELLFYVKGKTGPAMSTLLRVLAILAFQPGGVTAFGHHFEAGVRSTELRPVEKQIRELQGRRL